MRGSNPPSIGKDLPEFLGKSIDTRKSVLIQSRKNENNTFGDAGAMANGSDTKSARLRKRASATPALYLMIPLALCSGNLLAQKIVRIDSPNLAMEEQEANVDRNSPIIFSNLGPTASDK